MKGIGRGREGNWAEGRGELAKMTSCIRHALRSTRDVTHARIVFPRGRVGGPELILYNTL